LENKLSQEDKEICDEGITLDEISKAVKLQKPDKIFHFYCPSCFQQVSLK
jgi:hypothetical protein